MAGSILSLGLGLAVAEVAGQDPYSTIISLGPVGFILVLFLVGKIRTEGEVKRLEEEVRKKDERIEKLQDTIIDKAIPALVQSTDLLQRIAPGVISKEGQK